MTFVRRLFGIVVILAILVVAGRLAMPFMARRLIRSDSLVRSDLIVVLGSLTLERTIEAGTLFREGWAPKILLLRSPDYVRDRLRRQIGIHVPVYLDIQTDVLRQMGVPPAAIATSPGVQESTQDEAAAVAAYAHQNGYRRIIVVTSPYHTARAGKLLDNAAKGFLQIIVHPDRYESVNPDRWWTRFPDRSSVVLEYLKRIYALFR